MKIAFTKKPEGVSSYLPANILEKWNPKLKIKSEVKAENLIEMFDVIGYDYWDDGITASMVSARLQEIGSENPVEVRINSGGGDMFEGIAIYNLLKEHKGEVTVKVLGLAASAASIIAMAGDVRKIDPSSFFMIHNAWVTARGDRNDFISVSEYLAPFDAAMAEVYKNKTGLDLEEIVGYMNKETWFNGDEALEKGFATDLLVEEVIEEDDNEALAALRQVEATLRNAGYSRSKTKALMKELKNSKPSATVEDTPSAIDLSETVALATQLKA